MASLLNNTDKLSREEYVLAASGKSRNNLIRAEKSQSINGDIPVHGVEWVWLVMVPPLVVPHVDRDGRMEGGEEMVGTCGQETDRLEW